MERAIIGIDPGKNGGFCLMISRQQMVYYKSPVVGVEIDVNGYVDILSDFKSLCTQRDLDPIILLEDVHAIHGAAASTTFKFGKAVGLVIGAAIALKIPIILVQPKKWQSKAWKGVKIQKKKDGAKFKTDTKATSLLAAKTLFPMEDFLATKRSKVPHDGIVDATLIAFYGLEFYFND